MKHATVEPRRIENARRKTIKHAIIFLRDKPFSLKECPAIMELVIKADGLEKLPAEQRKRVLKFHNEELRQCIVQDGTLLDSVFAVERYLDSLSKQPSDKSRPFADRPPKLEERK